MDSIIHSNEIISEMGPHEHVPSNKIQKYTEKCEQI